MDWILLSYVFAEIWGFLLYFGFLAFLVVAASQFVYIIENDKTFSVKPCLFKWILPALLIGCIFEAIATLPRALLCANIAHIKLRYTDMETVEILESEAIKVIEKIDALIDKEINK